MSLQKPVVTLGGVELAAHAPIGWRFQTGTVPYMTTFSVLNSDWDRQLKQKIGKPLTLVIVDGYSTRTVIQQVYILEIAASSKPSVTSFVVADRRWKWNRKLIARVYNVTRKTGDVRFDGVIMPVEAGLSIAQYDYKPYSLFQGETPWTARQAVQDVLEQIEPDGNVIDLSDFPATDQFTLQNITLRDMGDVALSRLLSFIPGAQVWITKEGQVKMVNRLDLDAARKHRDSLPPSTWDGEKDEVVDRSKIRPSRVHVYYERELEVVVKYTDDYAQGTNTGIKPNELYIENVIPTVDPETKVNIIDPVTGNKTPATVPPGTWVPAQDWLEAMDKVKPAGSLPWTFNTIKDWWLTGGLEGILLKRESRGANVVDTQNAQASLGALRQHFRQTFQINRKYMDRVQSVRAIRVALLDPITGARQPASVWGQTCFKPSPKGIVHTYNRKDGQKTGLWYNSNTLPDSGERLVDKAPSPQGVSFIDPDAGIFRIDGLASAYGEYTTVIQGFCVTTTGKPSGPVFNLREQDQQSIGVGMRLRNGENQTQYADSMAMKVMLTLVPGAPNNKGAFWRETVEASEIPGLFNGSVRVDGGDGPELEVFIPSGEVTARFAWRDDAEAEASISQIIGLNNSDPTQGGIVDDPETPAREDLDVPPGFTLVNRNRELLDHARSVAAEMLSPFADSIKGRIATRVPEKGIDLKGSMGGASIIVNAAPSGKVSAMHDFPGQSVPISRMALMSETTRTVVLGIVRFE